MECKYIVRLSKNGASALSLLNDKAMLVAFCLKVTESESRLQFSSEFVARLETQSLVVSF